MAKDNFTVSANLKMTPDETAKILCSEEFLPEIYIKREEVVDASYKLLEEKENRTIFEVEEIHYKRTKTGKLDKSGTSVHKAEYRYSPNNQVLNFDFGASQKFKISGVYNLSESGSGTKISLDGRIDIPIPILGRVILPAVKKEMTIRFDNIVNGLKKRV
jgi:hypothetical protein